MSVHSASKRGKRPQNEDKHTVLLNLDGKDKNYAPINFYGVYDGHGGKEISLFLSKHMPKFFLNKKVKYPLVNKYVYNVFDHLQSKLKSNHGSVAKSTGSTCLVAVHYKHEDKEYINVFNTGDSRSVICTNNKAVQITTDHKPHHPEEKLRIKKAGGSIYFDGHDWRVKDLSVSRAFGDVEAEPYVICKPEIFTRRIGKNDKFMIMACDGLWDVLSNEEAVNFVLDNCYDMETGVRINKKINIAKQLAELALNKGTTDNVTTVVTFFN
uniref:PPM-type phosphatase domain-containing protein n=1 Tax=viral metagenome TaxID=1070528 RepID=A0A6C0E9R8_9ZZZZ